MNMIQGKISVRWFKSKPFGWSAWMGGNETRGCKESDLAIPKSKNGWAEWLMVNMCLQKVSTVLIADQWFKKDTLIC